MSDYCKNTLIRHIDNDSVYRQQWKRFMSKLLNAATPFAQKIKSCFSGDITQFERTYRDVNEEELYDDAVYCTYKFIINNYDLLKNNRWQMQDIVKFCEKILSNEFSFRDLRYCNKLPDVNKEHGIIEFYTVCGKEKWLLYYFRSKDSNNQFKAFLIKDSKTIMDMFDVSKPFIQFASQEISYSQFIIEIIQSLKTINPPKDKNKSCIICGSKNKNPYSKRALCFHCWVLIEYITANKDSHWDTIYRKFKKTKQNFTMDSSTQNSKVSYKDTVKETLNLLLNEIPMLSRRFPLPSQQIEFCLKQIFDN